MGAPLRLGAPERPGQMNRAIIWMLLGAWLLPCARADLCNVLDFGAKADGRTLDTKSINLAIHTHRCTTVMLPAGEYLSGTIRLKSNMVLELQHGAVLLGAPDGNYEPAGPPNPRANVCVSSAWASRMASGLNGSCTDYGHAYWSDALVTGAHLT